jgi:hypothetical protein
LEYLLDQCTVNFPCEILGGVGVEAGVGVGSLILTPPAFLPITSHQLTRYQVLGLRLGWLNSNHHSRSLE